MAIRDNRRRQVQQDSKRRKLVFYTCMILLSLYFTVNLTVGENSIVRYFELSSTRDRLFAENMALMKQKEGVENEINILKNKPEMIEELAREYGFTKEGELVFKFDDKE